MPPLKVTITGLDRVKPGDAGNGGDKRAQGFQSKKHKSMSNGDDAGSRTVGGDLRSTLSSDRAPETPKQLFTKKRSREDDNKRHLGGAGGGSVVSVDPEQKALEFRGKLQEQKRTYSQLEAKLDSVLKEMDKCKRENAALMDENRQMKREMEDLMSSHDRQLKQASRDINQVRNEKKNADAEVQRMLEKESKAQEYIKDLAKDLRDIQEERRQLIKIIDRYSAGGPPAGGRERGGADDRARDRRSPDRRGYGDEGRDGRGRDRSRERRDRSREREKRSPTTGAWRGGDTGRLDGRVGVKNERTLKQEDDGDM